MNHLKEENYSSTLKKLKEADKMLKAVEVVGNNKLHAITLNNFGCFYKRINKPNVALKFLKQACDKESIEPIDRVNLAGTLLNICAIYSQLGKHDIALEHGCKALRLVEKCEASSPNLVSTLIIGYHNTGVEYEFLNCLTEAVECYRSSWQFALNQLGQGSGLTQSMHKSYAEALEKLEKSTLKSNQREFFRSSGRVQPQERKISTGQPAVRRLPEITPYIKSKSSRRQRPKHRKVNSVTTEDTIDLAKIRFLTGDRLQPMNKSSPFCSIQMKPVTVEAKLRPMRLEAKPSQLTEKSQKINQIIKEKPEEAEDADDLHKRTSSAPVNIDISTLQKRIKNLEHRYEDFDKKVKPIKDQLPDLENFKFDKIAAFYEKEKNKGRIASEVIHVEDNQEVLEQNLVGGISEEIDEVVKELEEREMNEEVHVIQGKEEEEVNGLQTLDRESANEVDESLERKNGEGSISDNEEAGNM